MISQLSGNYLHSILLYYHRLFKPAAANNGCVPYYLEQTSPGQQNLWCRDRFSRCDCVSIQSSNGDTELTLSEAESQLGRIVNQAELFGVSSTCRRSYLTLYCHQVYMAHQDTTAALDPSLQRVCPEDCKRVISTECGNDWAILSNIIAQFIQRGTVQLPALRQLADCGTLDGPNADGNGNESQCISLQTRKLIYFDQYLAL